MYSPSAEELLLGTAAQESLLGFWLKQTNGPALGLYQMEPATEHDIWVNYLAFRGDRKRMVYGMTGATGSSSEQMMYNPIYSTIMARLHYRRVSEPFPDVDDIDALAQYWDTHYNRNPKKGFPKQWVQNYMNLVLFTAG